MGATPGQGPDRPQEVSYTDTKVIGNGSFGVVYQAKLCDTGEMVAIKKVLQDKRFKVSVCVFAQGLIHFKKLAMFNIYNDNELDWVQFLVAEGKILFWKKSFSLQEMVFLFIRYVCVLTLSVSSYF